MKLTLLFLLALWVPSPDSGQGTIHLEPPGMDLGQVRSGQVFERQVRVTNSGSTPITLKEIKSSCGCLHPKLEPAVLAPGQGGNLTLKVNTLSASPGVQGWRVRLIFQDGGLAELWLRAEVLQELILTPASLTLYGDRPSNHTLILTDRRAKTLKIVSAAATSPLLSAAVTSPNSVELQVQTGFLEGRHEEELILTTDDPLYPRLHFPVKIVIRSRQRFTSMPREVELLPGSSVPVSSKLVTIRDQQGQPLAIDRIETSHPVLKAEMVRCLGSSAVVRVSMETVDVSQGPFTGSVTVRFRGTAQTLTLPVRCP